jgi:putative membrane protein
MPDWHNSIWMSALGAVAFGIVGIVLTILGYFLFDAAARRIDVQTELAEKHNIAVAIVAAAVIIGVAMVVSAAISG